MGCRKAADDAPTLPIPQQGPTPAPALWQAPSAHAPLASAVPVGPYTIQPPQDYRLVITHQQKNKPPFTRYEWTDSTAPDGAHGRIIVVIRKTRGQQANLSSKILAARTASQIFDHAVNMTCFEPEEGAINGLEFAGEFGEGTYKSGDTPIHFFAYVSVQLQTDSTVEIAGIAREPFDKAALPLLQASALTLKKRS